ncbi:phosphotransferase [Cribrihabitans neustonicus]|uniref:phosphotransferase n=1 Tax=Cribrihabitans neustonicus TaxID=1429085 RepID=UPI003B594B95
MGLFSEYDDAAVQQRIAEFQSACDLPGETAHNCIHKSGFGKRPQMVFSVVHENGQSFALKYDLQEEPGWLSAEYDKLLRLQAHFDGDPRLSVTGPVYLGRDGTFHVTRFAAGQTATGMFRHASSAAQAAQVFRRAGAWLNKLHNLEPASEDQFHTGWIFAEIDAALALMPGGAARDGAALACVDALAEQAAALQGSTALSLFAHGDFHGGNLIFGKGTACGLDLAYAHRKLGLYDVVDFLMLDLRRPVPPGELGAGGICQHHVEMFLRTYRHPVPPDLLDFSLRAKLLTEWAKLSARAPEADTRAGRRLATIRERIARAFGRSRSGAPTQH